MSTRTALVYPYGSSGTFFAASTANPPLASSAVQIEYASGFSAQFSTSGLLGASSTQGTASLLGSNDNINYIPIAGSSAFMGTSGNLLINVGQAYYKYVKANFQPTAAPSSGFLNVALLYKAWGA